MLSANDVNEVQARLKEIDPEEAWAGGELALEETDDDLDHPPKRPAAKEKGLRLRGAIQLDEQEYAGKTSSRKAMFSNDDVLHASASALGDVSSSEDEEILEDGVGSTDRDIRELRRKQKAPAAVPDNGIDGAAALAFQEDPPRPEEEATALERELEAIRAQDEASITDRADRAAKERAKGAAVRNQKALWERALEMRILLQRCLQAANRLAQPHMHAAACSIRPELRSGYRGLADASAATIEQLLDLHDALLERTPAARLGSGDVGNKGTGHKRKRGTHSDDSIAGQQWQRLDAAYQRFAPFRDSSMDRWHRKTLLMTGSGALRSNLKALNQSLSAQVAALAKDSGPAVMRVRLPAALSNPLMGRPPKEDESEEDDHLEAAGEHRDAETFDDAEFYQQLLKEFLEGSAVGSGAGALAASATTKKRRKNVERRASKGRKLRYQVMEKLVHFMTPVPRTETILAPQLFSNLFGQPRNVGEAV